MHSQICIAKGIAKYAKIGMKNVKNALSYDTKMIIRKTQNLVNNLLGLQKYQKWKMLANTTMQKCNNATMRKCNQLETVQIKYLKWYRKRNVH